MKQKALELFFEELNPDDDGKVSRSAVFSKYHARTGTDLSKFAASTDAARVSSSTKDDDVQCAGQQDREPQQVRMQGGTSLLPSADTVSVPPTSATDGTILATSRTGPGTEATGAAGEDRRREDSTEELIDFEGFRAIVEGATEPGARDREGLVVDITREIGQQVESRTPPAMERNLFLSALANGKLEHHRNDVVITLKRVVAGGLAGMLAKAVVAPVDRVKILFQVTNEKFSFKKAEKLFQDILVLEGPAGLWKGNSATMIRVFPYAGTQFMMFDSLKRWALLRKTRRDPKAEQRLSNMESLMSGSFAGAISALVTYPLDLARARLAVGHSRKVGGRRRSMGVPELLRTVVREDGFRALYRGVTPSLMGIIPYAGIAFSINEQAKHEVLILTGKEAGTMHKLGIGAFAGLVAQSCTYPLEVTRRRMQTHGHVDTHAGVKKVFEMPEVGKPKDPFFMQNRLNIFQTLTAVFKEQGVGGLFKGLSMNWVKGPVGISISFTTFDFLKRRLGIS